MKGMIAILLLGVLTPVASEAQQWQAYTYTDPGFTIQFPAVPLVEASSIKYTSSAYLPVTRYTVRQERIIYTLSVANYSGTNADALSTIVQTQRSLGASGKVIAATGARINRHFGRALSLNGADGSHSTIAIFFVDKHLYTLIGQALPPNPLDESVDANHFLESLQFTDDNNVGGFFFGGGSERVRVSPGPLVPSAAAPAAAITNAVTPRPVVSHSIASAAPADAACMGKSAGDTVQLETPSGPVAAICTLVARPK